MHSRYVIKKGPDGYVWELLDEQRKLLAKSVQPFPTIEECRRVIEAVRASWRATIHEDPTLKTN
jgi:hypothetical protein